ncbi:MAG: sigma-70 family RNA polymerase sigma factor [Erysipelotrichales bacterium]|nr:sigma-70 family RNA polymerase sigma factor [Erysipelotrichales bacterium]
MEEYLQKYDWLIRSTAKKFYNVEWEDLYQAGYLGLIKAFNNYRDPNVEFGSYAKNYVFGEMYELSLKCRNIKLNKNYLKIYKMVNQTKSHLTQKLGREAALSDISAYLDIDLSEITYVVTIMEDMFSLDDEYANIQVGAESNLDEQILIRDSIDSLDPLSSAVINYRLNYDLTQKEVADILGISQVKVSRIESKGKNKILEYIS